MSRPRRVLYVTGTRADFGLMATTLASLHADSRFELGIAVTGMHLLAEHGYTVDEVEGTGFPIIARIPVELNGLDGASMARAISTQIAQIIQTCETWRPDWMLVLGDRGEMLAATIAASHMMIAVAHIHGGERSGTIDESVRHAISKLAHVHLVATEGARKRLIRLGERSCDVHRVGAPGIDGLVSSAHLSRRDLCLRLGLEEQQPVALLLYHPVLQDADKAGSDFVKVAEALSAIEDLQVIGLAPNADGGSAAIRAALTERDDDPRWRFIVHLARSEFVSWMAAADVMVGNSSAGIIEAASFSTPVVNIGDRQLLRERNANIVDVPVDTTLIREAVLACLQADGSQLHNIYGDGNASRRITELLASYTIDSHLLKKCNTH